MIELIATLLMLQVNLYRLEADLPYVPSDTETCAYADYRLGGSKAVYSHKSFLDKDQKTEGMWYENLGRIIKNGEDPLKNSQVILKDWKNSPKHNANLIANMNTMCIKTDGVNYVFIAHGKQDTDN